jgi:thiol-disulfide isomerase/thioredoxin
MIHYVNSKDFILQDLDITSPIGEFGKIKNSRTKLNVLMIKNNNCGHCVRYFPEYLDISSDYSNVNFLVLETSTEVNHKILDHWRNLISPAFPVNGVPTIVIYDADGKFDQVVEDRGQLRTLIKKLL